MGCPHCSVECDLQPSGWCGDCERASVARTRSPTSHVARLGLCLLITGGIALVALLLGLGYLSPLSAFPSLWAINSLSELRDRRQRQRLQDARLPRAYLASKT